MNTVAHPLLLAADDSAVSPGVLGFLVVASLGVATWLLLRSMRRQMKKIDFNEDGQSHPTPAEPAAPVEPTDERPGSAP